MTIPRLQPLPKPGFFTAIAMDDRIECLIHSADWYKTPPIRRYLYNMAAREIRMEDCKTETRVYTYERFEHMRQLLLRCDVEPQDTAFEAFITWYQPGLSFGVVHLEKRAKRKGDLLVGDDPFDVQQIYKAFGGYVDAKACYRLSTGYEGVLP